ncbi:MAG: endonuclease III [Candidatus Zixiibacteriota bacterium]
MARESVSDKRARAQEIVRLLKKQYPDACCSLRYKTVHQLMVATILSAQCTDERVNAVTPSLFKRYKSIKAFAEADLTELANEIFSTGFHNSKARSIRLSAQMLVKQYGGKIPRQIDQLVKLAGVGRKTASVILGAGFGLAEGIVVDTHVGRISRLLALTSEKDPAKVEYDLVRVIEEPDWIAYSHLIIFHGRAVCKARTPDCPACTLRDLCPSAG